jgi:hypothetical protein
LFWIVHTVDRAPRVFIQEANAAAFARMIVDQIWLRHEPATSHFANDPHSNAD